VVARPRSGKLVGVLLVGLAVVLQRLLVRGQQFRVLVARLLELDHRLFVLEELLGLILRRLLGLLRFPGLEELLGVLHGGALRQLRDRRRARLQRGLVLELLVAVPGLLLGRRDLLGLLFRDGLGQLRYGVARLHLAQSDNLVLDQIARAAF